MAHNHRVSATPRSLGPPGHRDSAICPQEVAIQTIASGKLHDGVKIGLCLTASVANDNESFLRSVAAIIHDNLGMQDHLFIIGNANVNAPMEISSYTSTSPEQVTNVLIIFGSSYDYIDRARRFTGSKFPGRIASATGNPEGKQWIASVLNLGADPLDENALWDVARKSVCPSSDPRLPPPGSKGIDDILAEARADLARITPEEAYAELCGSHPPDSTIAPTVLVDTRSQALREKYGTISGSIIIERNVLEWRLDPKSNARLPIADRYDLRVIVLCQEGYSSSLVARSLQQLGLYNATDVVGGFDAWKEAGLPIDGPVEHALQCKVNT